MFNDFKSRLKKTYQINKRWVKIIKLIKLRNSFTNTSSNVKQFFATISSTSVFTFISKILTLQRFNKLTKKNFILSLTKSQTFEQTIESISMHSLFIVTKSIVLDESWISSKDLRFWYRNDLIYYVNNLNNEQERFCISKLLVDEIFALTHNRLNHVDYHKIYDIIITFFLYEKY